MRQRAIPFALAAAAYLLAVVQRPGALVADTKVDLYVDPGSFLADVASAWTPTGQLGHVFAGQYGGYLFPMAPWFAAGDASGLPMWLVHRLWLGTLLAFAAVGVVKLLDALLDRPRGAPHVAAAVLYVLNPYVAVYANRTSVALLAYAALPWLLLAVHRGLRDPRAWRWPALFALAMTCTGGGVNAATTGWVLLAPALFLVYERVYGGIGRGALTPFLVRLVPAAALANAWWVVPLLVHMRFGVDFLEFTEQPGTIWQTTSLPESLRLMGFWTSYIGVGFGGALRPFASHGPVLVFHPAVLVASLLVPALALTGFAWTRRWRYAPFFLLMTLAGLLVMTAGFPEGTLLRRAVTFTYNHLEAVQFLRTTYKAGPLVALGLAALGGAAFGVAWARWSRGLVRAGLAAGALVLAAVAAWPLTTGTAPERQLEIDVPSWQRGAAARVDALPANERAIVLPGHLFGYYDWGGTIDPILPVLADRPVAHRSIVPYSDLRAVDLQWAVDALVSQERAVPGQLAPLLDVLGAGLVVTNADEDRSRSGGPVVVRPDELLERQIAGEARVLGPVRRERAEAGDVRGPRRMPRVTLRGAETGGIVRLLPREPLTVLDGGAEGIAALAAFGALDPDTPLAYAADVPARAIAEAGEVVVTDTNRRQAFVAARMRANRGFVLQADEEVSEDGAILDPFAAAGADAQTVSRLRGVRSVWSPFSPQVTQFPEHRPFAALDGDVATAWLADRNLARERHSLEITLDRPREVPHVDVLPYGDERARPKRLRVDGREVRVGRGWTRVPIGRRVGKLRVAILRSTSPKRASAGVGGIAELRIPGVRARETLRPPVLAERAARRNPTYLFARMTVDAPRRSGAPTGPFQTFRLRDRVDPERQLSRTVAPPRPGVWRFDAWTSATGDTPDAELDRLTGTRGARVESSGRYGDEPRFRGSGAFDATPRRAWIAPWLPGRVVPRLTVTVDRAATVRRLRIVPPRERVRLPTHVRLNGVPAVVASDGTLELDRAVRARRFTFQVDAARFPEGTRDRMRRAVGIGELVGIPGARVRPGRGRLRGRCGDASLVTRDGPVQLRAVGTVDALDRGEAIGAIGCAMQPLPAGEQDVRGADGPLTIDQLRMRGAGPPAPTEQPSLGAPSPFGEPAAGSAAGSAGRVLSAGDPGRGKRDGVRLDVREPAWLVLGESYSRGWRATCDGKDLGAPVPLQGYANGWRVEPGCADVDLAFAPNRLMLPAYAISLLACLVLLAVLILRRRAPRVALLGAFADDDAPTRWPLRRALAAGLVAAVVLGFVFALRVGVVLGPAVAVVLWRGVPARQLALAGGALLLVVVPILYLAIPVDDPGGYNTNVSNQRINAHWVAVGAVFCLGAALVRTLSTARARASAGPGSAP